MSLRSTFNRIVGGWIFPTLDRLFTKMDKTHVWRTASLRKLPYYAHRRGGKNSYAEWAHVIGVFQSLMYQATKGKENPKLLDVGCGTGLLGISAYPLVMGGGHYHGLDVIAGDIQYCRSRFTEPGYSFEHIQVKNPTYANHQQDEKLPWPTASDSQDLVTALSVWTHLNEEDALYYFKEVARVLKPGGKAIITFFYLDDLYHKFLPTIEQPSKFYPTDPKVWVYSEPAYGSENWRCPKWVKYPEDATAVTPKGIEMLLESSGLTLADYHPGVWKNHLGLYFQDVLVFEKPSP